MARPRQRSGSQRGPAVLAKESRPDRLLSLCLADEMLKGVMNIVSKSKANPVGVYPSMK